MPDTPLTPSPSEDAPVVDRARLDRLLGLVPDAVAMVDEECRIIWISGGAVRTLGHEPEELVGTLAYDLFSKQENRELHRLYFEGVLASPGQHGPVEVTVTGSDREFRELELLLTNALDDPSFRAVAVSIRDITHRPGDLEELRRREAWADALIRRGAELIMVTDRTGTVSYANPASAGLLGVGPDELVGSSWLDLVVDARGDTVRGVVELLEDSGDHPTLLRIRRPDGEHRTLSVYASNLLGDPDVAGIVVNASDVTERLVAEHLLAEQASLLEAMARGLPLLETIKWIMSIIEERVPGATPMVGILDPDGWIRYPIMPRVGADLVEALNQMPPSSDLGTSFREIGRAPLFITHLAGRWWDPLRGHIEALGVQACWIWPTFSQESDEMVGALVVMHTEQREPSPSEAALLERSMHLVAIAIDRHRLESTLQHRALHDSLTGLPNRVALLERIEEAIERSTLTGRPLGVLFVDLDRFKLINDTLGHGVGDLLLEQVGARFRHALRPSDVVGRFGGDEFVVVCEDLDDEGFGLGVAERLRAALLDPFVVDGREMVITASIGITRTIGGGIQPEALIRDADVAMYRAKGQGRDTSAVFQVGDRERLSRALELEGALRSAIDAEELDVHCQPVVRVEDGSLVGFEALVRWSRADGTPVSPMELIPVAEESGLILPLGRWVLRRACAAAAAWPPGPGGEAPWVSVNVSARQFADVGFPGHVTEALEWSGLDPHRLCLELTETAFVGDGAVTTATVVALKSLGVRIGIDDFGTGHASLDYIRRFAVADVLKIDRSFVAGLEDDAGHDRAIAAAVVALGRSLGFTVIAEGVETPGQRDVLCRLGCEMAQGYWYARPLPTSDLGPILAAGVLPVGPSVP